MARHEQGSVFSLRHKLGVADLDGAVLQILGDIVVVLCHVVQDLAHILLIHYFGEPAHSRGALTIKGGIFHSPINCCG